MAGLKGFYQKSNNFELKILDPKNGCQEKFNPEKWHVQLRFKMWSMPPWAPQGNFFSNAKAFLAMNREFFVGKFSLLTSSCDPASVGKLRMNVNCQHPYL